MALAVTTAVFPELPVDLWKVADHTRYHTHSEGFDVADEMEEWLETEASDGFTVMFPYLPGGLDDFVDRVVPVLQDRGLFRREYEGVTLRENMGLPRPENQFFGGG